VITLRASASTPYPVHEVGDAQIIFEHAIVTYLATSGLAVLPGTHSDKVELTSLRDVRRSSTVARPANALQVGNMGLCRTRQIEIARRARRLAPPGWLQRERGDLLRPWAQ
jgi:hypothetical protein